MSITRVQKKTNSASGATSTTVTLDSAPTTGNLLVAQVTYRSDRTLTAPAEWTEAVDVQAATPDVAQLDEAIWYKISEGDETATAWTIDTTGFVAATVREYSSDVGWPADPLDQVASDESTGSETEHPTGTTPATTSAVQVAAAVVGFNVNTATASWSNDFIETVETQIGASSTDHYSADKILSATGAQSSTVTTSSAGSGTGAIATFAEIVSSDDLPTVGLMGVG